MPWPCWEYKSETKSDQNNVTSMEFWITAIFELGDFVISVVIESRLLRVGNVGLLRLYQISNPWVRFVRQSI